jgi:hypothetical protein
MGATGTSGPKIAWGKTQLNDFFRRVYRSDQYKNFTRDKLSAVAAKHQGNFGKAWHDLTNEYCVSMDGNAVPVFWDVSRSIVTPTINAYTKQCQGCILLGFVTIAHGKKPTIVKAQPLPIFEGEEIKTVTKVIEAATVL